MPNETMPRQPLRDRGGKFVGQQRRAGCRRQRDHAGPGGDARLEGHAGHGNHGQLRGMGSITSRI